ncbi:hypothetical protein F6A13_06685 [Acidithiobacillus sp. 'AMD consortium']|jgi:hypothetical protein|uniref:hypothetical protein n=1 Tax=Acidithiobacillus TaxID=119977 RepID=UPI00017F7018|nr:MULTISPECIES: hypothetical protein [Acidithiobacillus]ACH83543.1 hypothetical protein Lferr_1308 [Acidithiobacillus ferrooxidans ATCC 53993]MBU2772372.1 hypothetical protein [Acidithiobacillus ferrooxidans]MBU2807205.1 hypothetical protein [Acidithiobacillus ferrooxidans F221]MBU2815896.1 hypothetical protein [Acidithiobacillus ferrooxidans]MCR1342215.1 hypothetical protein [Acidithiobacillus ferrooxidans]
MVELIKHLGRNMKIPKWLIFGSLCVYPYFSDAAIYQCGNSFQGTPCNGEKIISGAPTTDDDQSDNRFQTQEAQQRDAEAARAKERAIQLESDRSIARAIRNSTVVTSPPLQNYGGMSDREADDEAEQENQSEQNSMNVQQQHLDDQNNAQILHIEHNLNPDVSTNPDNW